MIGRNAPCPCGSGQKFKRCCLRKEPGPGARTIGEFGFEPGSYCVPQGHVPSLACFRESLSGERAYRFVLAKPTSPLGSKEEAAAQATADFSEACRVDDATGSIEAMGFQLGGLGSVVIGDVEIVDPEA